MNDWSDGKKLGELRTVFAWTPIQVYRVKPMGITPTRKVWLRKVVMMWTFFGWYAYEDDQ